jgi:hypothetical protein
VNEIEWLYSGDPTILLRFLLHNSSKRKLRLFSCACLRDAGRIPEAEILERFAEGTATEADAIATPYRDGATAEDAWREAMTHCDMRDGADRQRERCCDWLRDIFGNPFQPRRLDAAWLRANDGAVRKMARAIYEENRFADLPILADALEEAGCDDFFLLHHCRSGEHGRGCWAVDLLLGQA